MRRSLSCVNGRGVTKALHDSMTVNGTNSCIPTIGLSSVKAVQSRLHGWMLSTGIVSLFTALTLDLPFFFLNGIVCFLVKSEGGSECLKTLAQSGREALNPRAYRQPPPLPLSSIAKVEGDFGSVVVL